MNEEIMNLLNQPPNNDRRKWIGRLGELYAAAYVQQQGYVIAAHNWRCRTGEIDLIAREGNKIIFMEVRSRTYIGKFGTAKESVNHRKQMKVRRTAEWYIQMQQPDNLQVRLDVIAVLLDKEGAVLDIEHIENAF